MRCSIRQNLADDNSADIRFRDSLEKSHFELGILLLGTGKAVASESESGKALEIRRKLVDDYPSDIGNQGGLGYDYLRVAAFQA